METFSEGDGWHVSCDEIKKKTDASEVFVSNKEIADYWALS